MTKHADEVRALLDPVVRDAQVDMGPTLWQRLKNTVAEVYAACEHEDEEARVQVDLMNELIDERDDNE